MGTSGFQSLKQYEIVYLKDTVDFLSYSQVTTVIIPKHVKMHFFFLRHADQDMHI